MSYSGTAALAGTPHIAASPAMRPTAALNRQGFIRCAILSAMPGLGRRAADGSASAPPRRAPCHYLALVVIRAAPSAWRIALVRLSLPGDDLALDAVVDARGEDLPVHQVVLALVRPSLDDRLGTGRADPGQLLQVVGGGAVDVEQRRRGLGCRQRRGRLG